VLQFVYASDSIKAIDVSSSDVVSETAERILSFRLGFRVLFGKGGGVCGIVMGCCF